MFQYGLISDSKGWRYTKQKYVCARADLNNCEGVGLCDEIESGEDLVFDTLAIGSALGCAGLKLPSISLPRINTETTINCLDCGGGGGTQRVSRPFIRQPQPPGGIGCFVPGTPVEMADGSVKRIEDIMMGDAVLGFDGQPASVTETYVRTTDHLRELRYRNIATGELHRVETTDEHLYWVQSRQAWVLAGELEPGDVIALSIGYAELELSSRRETDAVVYNFDVADKQSYFANKALVYQQCDADTDPDVTRQLLEIRQNSWPADAYDTALNKVKGRTDRGAKQ